MRLGWRAYQRFGSALLLLTSSAATIAVADARVPQVKVAPKKTAAPHAVAVAAPAPAPKRPTHYEAANVGEEVSVTHSRSVFAGGLMRRQTAPEATSTISAAAIQQRAAASSPLQLISSLPGANVGMSDAYGLSIRNDLTVRGLDQAEIGWTIEGVPGIDQAYLLPYSETWADNENISEIALVAGTSHIQDPLQSASGGEMIETVRDPNDVMGGKASYSAGSFRGQRGFGSLDTGYIGHSGVKMFGSMSYTAADNWTVAGRTRRYHVDFKTVKEWGDYGKSSLFISYNNWDAARINPLTLKTWEAANRVDNNFSTGNYASNYVPGGTAYWKSAVYKRSNLLLAWNNEFQLSRALKVHLAPYFHWTDSNSPGQSTLTGTKFYYGNEAVTISPVSGSTVKNQTTVIANSNQTQFDTGINAYLEYDVSKSNHLSAGYWYDHWNMDAINGFAALNQSGEAENNNGKYILYTTNGLPLTGLRYQMSSQINTLFLSDTQSLANDKVKINVGFKYMMDYISGTNLLPGSQYHFSSAFSQPLPRVSVSWTPTSHIQLYLNATTNTRAPVPLSTYPNLYSITNGSVTQLGNTSARPEYSIGEEVGFRYHGVINADFAAFNTNLTNHQVTSQAIVNGAASNSAIAAGGETLRGFTVEVSSRPFFGLSPYANAQYLHATMDNNFQVGNDLLPTAGKTAVRSPKYMANIGMLYSHGPFFANLMFKWVDSQYSTFMNDQSMPAYKTVDLALGYHLPRIWKLHDPVIRLNFINLTNVAYLSTPATIVANAVTTRGVHGTTLAGSTPSYYLGTPLTAMMTVTASF